MSSLESAMSALTTGFQGSLSFSEQPSLRPPQMTSSSPLDASAAQTKHLPLVKLASFERCSCDRLDGGQAHLSVHTHETELHELRGVAISYAWGEFDRQERRIGHDRDNPDKAVIIELGAEWRVSSVQERLAQLTEQHEGCWIDQICMPKGEEKIRKTLAAIPAIYHTLHVTVLLPGSLCGCLRKSFDEYQAARFEVDGQEVSADQPSEASVRLDRCMERLRVSLSGSECLNSNGACSWTKRLWTLQEFVYSRSCSFLFANQEVMECCKWEDFNNSPSGTPEQLNDYSRRWYEDCVEWPWLSTEEVRLFLSRENFSTYTRLRLHVMCEEAPTGQTWQDDLYRLASQLLGDVQVWHVRDVTSDGLDALWVLQTLMAVAHEPRTATEVADYIVSIFPGLKRYTVPKNFNHLTPTELLEDALAQLHNLSNFFVPNHSPAGLSRSISRSARWFPGISRAATVIKNSLDLFGSLWWSEAVRVNSLARLPLKFQSTRNTVSLARNAQDFDTWVEVTHVYEAIAHFIVLVQQWKGYYNLSRFETRFAASFDEGVANIESSSESEKVARLIYFMKWVSSPKHAETFEDMLVWLSTVLRGIDTSFFSMRVIEKAIYGLTCEILHLDVTRSEPNEIRAVFSQYTVAEQARTQEGGMLSQTCVGLVNGESFDQARSSGAELLTISLGVYPERPFYEAVRVPETSPPEYRIIGVWVPLLNEIRVAEVGAIMVHDQDEHNAYVI